MNTSYKKYPALLTYLVSICAFFCAAQLTAENVFYDFGPKTDNVIVLTAPASADNQSTTATIQLQDFARKLSHHAPDIHIIIAVTKNDIAELPAYVPVKRYGGIKQLIQTLNAYANVAVCIIDAGNPNSIKLTAGTSAGTAPSWFLQSAYYALQSDHTPVDFYSNALIFHRLGWIPDDPALRLFNEAHIPALKIETNADLSRFFSLFPALIQKKMSNEWDAHYFTLKIHGKLIIINEKHIVLILISSSMLILLWLMVFSFLFGKKREQHIKDLLLLWWMPIYFFLINWGGFLLGTKIAELLFYLRFSSTDTIAFFPMTALSIKYLFALFFMLVFTAFNKFIPLPANRFIYGFMAHTVCLLNIFIFSFINFSFSIVFLTIYFISFAAYHFKNIVLQIIFIICLFLPLIPFAHHILLYRRTMYEIILFTHAAPALIFVPFDLFLIRLALTVEKKQKQKKRIVKIPLQCKVSGLLLCALLLWVILMPADPMNAQYDFILVQRITDTGNTVIKKYRGSFQTEEPVEHYTRDDAIKTAEIADSFLKVKSSLTNYFERSIGNIIIDSPIRVEAVAVTVSAKNGVAVFEADTPFEQNASGDTAVFISSPRPALPIIIHFSGKKNADLAVTVELRSKENYFTIRLPQQGTADVQDNFLLEIIKMLHIKAASAE